MARKKVKLAFIVNDAARKATFRKRKRGLLKKVSELSTLCGIEVCAIICSPFDAQPDVWPNLAGAQQVLSKLKMLPETEQSKKMMTQEEFLKQRIAKVTEQLKKVRKENLEKEMKALMFQCMAGRPLDGMNMMDLNGLAWSIDQRLKEVDKRLKELDLQEQGQAQQEMGSSSLAIEAAGAGHVENAVQNAEGGAEGAVNLNMVQNAEGNVQAAAPSDINTGQRPYFTSLLFDN